jgi:hypothetical protein
MTTTTRMITPEFRTSPVRLPGAIAIVSQPALPKTRSLLCKRVPCLPPRSIASQGCNRPSLASYGEGRCLPLHSGFAGVHRSQRLRPGITGRQASAGAPEGD